MKEKYQHKKTSSGFIALTSVSIMGAFFIIIFMGMFFSSTEEMDMVDGREGSARALALANSCVEEGLNNLRKVSGYSGNQTIDVGEHQCHILKVEGTESMRVIKAIGEDRGYTKKIQVEVGMWSHPALAILDWREVSHFTEFAYED